MPNSSQILIAVGVIAAIALLLYFATRRTRHPVEAHVFLDLETLGFRQDAPLLVIAAYAVDALGDKIAQAVWRIDPENAKLYGDTDASTVKWWSEQSEAARFEAFEAAPRIDIPEALESLTAFIRSLSELYGDQVFIWGNAPTFDCAILRYAYLVAGRPVPWDYWQERDVRTIAWLGEAVGYDAKQFITFEGERHVALDDARHQARYTMEIINELRGR